MRLIRLAVILFIPIFLFTQKSYPRFDVYDDQDCLECHGKPDIAQIMSDGKVRSLFVDPAEWNQDIHHKGNLVCVDCHTQANPYLHFREGAPDVDCARCHPEEDEEYQKNIHLTFAAPSPGKELPLCYHCHTKHHVLPHDNPQSSVHENNIGQTCLSCHAEVMLRGIFSGGSLGKISGHRKGDISERFDMNICISCHYQDSAHGSKRVYKDFCSRCHDVRSLANPVMGSTHINSQKGFPRLNELNSALVLAFVIGICVVLGIRSRKSFSKTIKSWIEGMKIEIKDTHEEEEGPETGVKEAQPHPEQVQEEIQKEETDQKQEKTGESEPEEKNEKEASPEEQESSPGKEDTAQTRKGEEQVEERKDEQALTQDAEQEEQTAQTDKEEHTPDDDDEGDKGNEGPKEEQ